MLPQPALWSSPFPKIKEGFQKIYEDIDLAFQTVINFEDGLNQIRKQENPTLDLPWNNEFSIFNYESLLMIPWGEFGRSFL